MMLIRIVQTTVIDRVVSLGRCALIAITANTMVTSQVTYDIPNGVD